MWNRKLQCWASFLGARPRGTWPCVSLESGPPEKWGKLVSAPGLSRQIGVSLNTVWQSSPSLVPSEQKKGRCGEKAVCLWGAGEDTGRQWCGSMFYVVVAQRLKLWPTETLSQLLCHLGAGWKPGLFPWDRLIDWLLNEWMNQVSNHLNIYWAWLMCQERYHAVTIFLPGWGRVSSCQELCQKLGRQQNETQTVPSGAYSQPWRGKQGNSSSLMTDGMGPQNKHLTQFQEFKGTCPESWDEKAMLGSG